MCRRTLGETRMKLFRFQFAQHNNKHQRYQSFDDRLNINMERSMSSEPLNGDGEAFLDLNGYSQSPYEQMLGETSYPMEYRGVSPMIAMSSNFHYPTRKEQTADPTDSKPKQNFYYSRHHNPNFSLLEQQIQILHGGSRAFVFPTGMGAASSVLISLSRKDSTIVYSDELYHDVPDLLEEMRNNFAWKSYAVDICNTKQVVEKVKEVDARILFLETCSNPSNKVPSLKKLVEQVREVAPRCIIVVDNTFMSPVLFRPLDYGVDIVIESATKYLSGKGDVLLGVAVLRKSKEPNGVLDNTIANIGESLHRWRLLSGCSPSPMNCWLVSKGLETLGIRMPHVSNTAMEVALALEKIPCISRVLYCGLPSHPSHKRAKKLFGDKFSGIIRFHVPGNSIIVGKLQQDSGLVAAVSLGESHTLLPPPQQGQIAVFPGDDKKYPVMSGFWFRIAIGLESANDIKQHLLYAFAAQKELCVELGIAKKINEKKQKLEIKITDKELLSDWKKQINNKMVFIVVKEIKKIFFVSLKDTAPKDAALSLKLPWTAQDLIKDHIKPDTQLFTFKHWLPLARECQKIVESK